MACLIEKLRLNELTHFIQTALKVAACFGIKILQATARSLSSTDSYSTLVSSLDTAVEDGLMDLVSDTTGSSYRFVHDKVRQEIPSYIFDSSVYP